jgi:hypothetical protein
MKHQMLHLVNCSHHAPSLVKEVKAQGRSHYVSVVGMFGSGGCIWLVVTLVGVRTCCLQGSWCTPSGLIFKFAAHPVYHMVQCGSA